MADRKISELPESTNLDGLYTLGTNSEEESVKVSLTFVKESSNAANSAALAASSAASAANNAASRAESSVLSLAAVEEQVDKNTGDIATLKGASKRIPTSQALPDTLTQAQVLAIWNTETGNKPVTKGDTLVSLNADTMNVVWSYFDSDGLWHYRGIDTVIIATDATIGVVKGSQAPGNVAVGSDGTMSVNGFDTKITGIGGSITGTITFTTDAAAEAYSISNPTILTISTE